MALTGLKLRCNIARCNQMTITASADVTSGQMAVFNDTVGVWVKDVDSGDDGAVIFKAPKILVPCEAISAGYTEGEKVYFDATEERVTETSSSNKLCGVVTEAPASSATSVEIQLDGTLSIVA